MRFLAILLALAVGAPAAAEECYHDKPNPPAMVNIQPCNGKGETVGAIVDDQGRIVLGDMVLGPAPAAPVAGGALAAATYSPWRRWKRGQIPIDARALKGVLREEFEAAVQIWSSYDLRTDQPGIQPLEFIACTQNVADESCSEVGGSRTFDDYVVVVKSQVCKSSIGMMGGRQTIEVGAPPCNTMGDFVHELGHTLGLVHEHQRPDRDKYITVAVKNVRTDRWDQMKVLSFEVCVDEYVPYDATSVMHYHSDANSCNNKPTLVGRPPLVVPPTKTMYPSDGDVATVRGLYRALLTTNPGVPWRGLGGATSVAGDGDDVAWTVGSDLYAARHVDDEIVGKSRLTGNYDSIEAWNGRRGLAERDEKVSAIRADGEWKPYDEPSFWPGNGLHSVSARAAELRAADPVFEGELFHVDGDVVYWRWKDDPTIWCGRSTGHGIEDARAIYTIEGDPIGGIGETVFWSRYGQVFSAEARCEPS